MSSLPLFFSFLCWFVCYIIVYTASGNGCDISQVQDSKLALCSAQKIYLLLFPVSKSGQLQVEEILSDEAIQKGKIVIIFFSKYGM